MNAFRAFGALVAALVRREEQRRDVGEQAREEAARAHRDEKPALVLYVRDPDAR